MKMMSYEQRAKMMGNAYGIGNTNGKVNREVLGVLGGFGHYGLPAREKQALKGGSLRCI